MWEPVLTMGNTLTATVTVQGGQISVPPYLKEPGRWELTRSETPNALALRPSWAPPGSPHTLVIYADFGTDLIGMELPSRWNHVLRPGIHPVAMDRDLFDCTQSDCLGDRLARRYLDPMLDYSRDYDGRQVRRCLARERRRLAEHGVYPWAAFPGAQPPRQWWRTQAWADTVAVWAVPRATR
jgi:hypothetical protein